jgi:ligand-binding SRPBCC domain-containing protein
MGTFEKKTLISASADALYQWHLEEGAFEILTPPWEKVRVLSRPEHLGDGAEVVLQIAMGPFRMQWVACHTNFELGRRFDDIQESGPFKKWQHSHRFLPVSEHSAFMLDSIEYELPGGLLVNRFGDWLVQRKLNRMFAYRHRKLRSVFDVEAQSGAGILS